jgi:hypothetical protein
MVVRVLYFKVKNKSASTNEITVTLTDRYNFSLLKKNKQEAVEKK